MRSPNASAAASSPAVLLASTKPGNKREAWMAATTRRGGIQPSPLLPAFSPVAAGAVCDRETLPRMSRSASSSSSAETATSPPSCAPHSAAYGWRSRTERGPPRRERMPNASCGE
eukprot:scaffold152536_cov30-Tisochrysis_lutea.AAC.5